LKPGSADAGRLGLIAWCLGVFLLVVVVSVVATAWAVRQATNGDPRLSEAQSRAILAIAKLPSLVRVSVDQVLNEFVRREPGPLLTIERAPRGLTGSAISRNPPTPATSCSPASTRRPGTTQ
jgi:hypothetical protein